MLRRNRLLSATVLSVLLCFSLVTSVRAEAAMWTQTYDRDEIWESEMDFIDKTEEGAHSLVATSDGGYALAGYTCTLYYGLGGYFGEPTDLWLVKTDASGNLEWNSTYGGADGEECYSLVATSDGGYALAGYTRSFGAGGSDFWLVKTDSAGNVEWNQTYGGEKWEFASSLVETSDGGYAMIGTTTSFGAGGSDFWLVKTDSAGNVEWNQTYGGEKWEFASSLVETSDGGYAMIGTTTSFGAGGSDFWLVKTDSAGNVEWNQTYGGEKWEFASSLVETSDGGYAMIGTTTSFGVDDSVDCWLVKTNATGDMEWHQTYGSPLYDVPRSVVETSDGGYALAGTWGKLNSYWPSEPEKDVHTAAFCLIKTDGFGNVEWNMTYGGGAIDEAYSLVETSDGGYAIAGVTTSFGTNVTEDFWLVKTDENGVAPVAPEATWVILPFLLAATVSIFISKKKLLNRRSKES